MATYCFSEGKREIFREMCLRGWLAAICDFPHFKSHEQNEATALQAGEMVRPEVCCIPVEDDFPYRQLVSSAWSSAYVALGRDVSKREIVLMASVLKPMSSNEALAFLRHAFNESGWSVIDEAYERFLGSI